MAYTPKTWGTGDRVRTTDLNHMEQGIANAGSAVIITDNGTALDKTYAEIYDLVNSGTPCYIKYNVYASNVDLDTDYAYHVRLMPVNYVYKYDAEYRIFASTTEVAAVGNVNHLGTAGAWIYSASTSTDYPTFNNRVYTTNSYLTKQSSRT